MFRLLAVASLVLLTPSWRESKQKDKHIAHFDGLIVMVTALGSTEGNGGKVSAPAGSPDPLVPEHVPSPPPPPPQGPTPDHHYVAVFVNVKNAGKNAACISFLPLLTTTAGLQYKGSFRTLAGPDKIFPGAPRISEMLPGEESNGSYVFLVKNGVSPLEMSLKPERKSIHCNESVNGNWGDALLPQELKFDVHDLSAPPIDLQQKQPPPLSSQHHRF